MSSTTEHVKAMNFRVSGRVQGVCFRNATVEEARRLDLRGWVKNLADGDVEVYASGDPAAIETLHRWLHQGPPMARVTLVRAAAADVVEFADFSISF